MERGYIFDSIMVVSDNETEEIRLFLDDAKSQGLEALFISSESFDINRDDVKDYENRLVVTDIGKAASLCKEKEIPVVGFIPSVENNCANSAMFSEVKAAELSDVKYVVDELCQVDEDYFNMVYYRAKKLPLMIAKTERTYIRELTLEDLPELRKMYEDEEILKWVEPLYDEAAEIAFEKDYIENMYGLYGYGLWLVFDKNNDKLIGRAGLSNRSLDGEMCVELGYIIGKDYRRKGIGKEVSEAIIKYAFEKLYLEKLFVITEKANEASASLAKSLGFSLYGDFEEFNIFSLARN